MSLATAIERETADTTTQCKTCKWLAQLDADDLHTYRDAVDAIAADSLTIASLWRACQLEGLNASESSFKRHLYRCVTR